jgi:hypothetical protein
VGVNCPEEDRMSSVKKLSHVVRLGLLMALITLLNPAALAQNTGATTTNTLAPANGNGVMVAGELWDSFMPANRGPFYSESSRPLVSEAVRIGNFDRGFTTPTHMWPGGWETGQFFSKGIVIAEFDPDTTFNPPTIGGASNPSYDAASGPRYALAAYANKPAGTPPRVIAGAGDPARDYSRETRWVDLQLRHHSIYEASWPTTIGLDVKMTVHQFTLPWNNFNDFIIVDLTLVNTGNLDMNADGVVEQTGHAIKALTLLAHGEFMCSYRLSVSGSRFSQLGATRGIGYIGDADPKGSPWGFVVAFPGENNAGARDMGLNDYLRRYYTEVWNGWTWLGAKDQAGGDKSTIYGTHAIGAGSQRGWYTSAGHRLSYNFYGSPKTSHTAAMGTWYADGGKSRSTSTFNLEPNTQFFQSGSTGDPTTFVPKGTPARPNGDRKLYSEESSSAFEVTTYENWIKGFTANANFDGDLSLGVGPFSLAVGESMKVAWAEVSGYRLAGVCNAIAAARWAYEHNYAVPSPPPVPDMVVAKPLNIPYKVFWDNRAEADAAFAGYKVYRTMLDGTVDWLAGGMRGLDESWRNTNPGATPEGLKKPVNPNFAAFSFVAGRYGTTGPWGPYELLAIIPKAQLAQYADGSLTGYSYSLPDQTARLNTQYAYYVSAYTAGTYDLGSTYAGTNSATSSTIETSNLNRNGASGLWVNTYPFATANIDFPRTTDGLKHIGAMVQRLSVLPYKVLSCGTVNIGSSATVDVLVRNSADVPLDVTVSCGQNTFVPVQPTFAVPPGDSIFTKIRFTPTSTGPDTGYLIVASNGISPLDTVVVSGIGGTGARYATFSWARSEDSSSGYTSGPFVALDSAGNFYSSAIDFTGYVSRIWRHSPAGVLLWTTQDSMVAYLRDTWPSLTGLRVGGNGDLYHVCNAFVRPKTTLTGAFSVAKYDPSGVLRWRNQWGIDKNANGPIDFALDGADNIYLTGTSRTSSGWTNYQITTLKMDRDGIVQWFSHFDGVPAPSDSSDAPRAITLDKIGNVFVGGSTRSSQNPDWVVIKYSPVGVREWVSYYDGSTGPTDEARDIAVDEFGDVYVTGISTAALGMTDLVTVKFRGADGARLWVNAYDGPTHGNDAGTNIVVSMSGDIFACGTSAGTANASSLVFFRYSKTGMRELLLQYGGPGGYVRSVTKLEEDREGNLYLGGTARGSLGFDESYVLKFRHGSGIEWEAHFTAGPFENTTQGGYAVGRHGELAVSGFSNTMGPWSRAFVAKYGQVPVLLEESDFTLPQMPKLFQNYPNPFNPSTTIRYGLPERSHVSLVVYNTLGQQVTVLQNGEQEAGYHEVKFDASSLPTGVYFYRLQAGSYVETRKLLVLR